MSEYRILVTVDQEAVKRSKIGKDLNFRIFSQALGLKDKKGDPGKVVPTTAVGFYLANTIAPSIDLTIKVSEIDPVWTDENENPKPLVVTLDPEVMGHETNANDAIKSLKSILTKQPLNCAVAVTVTEKRGKPKKPSDKPPRSATFPFAFHFELSPTCKEKMERRLRGRQFELEVNKALGALLPTLGTGCTVDAAAACQLLMGTANHETGFVSCNQSNGGPAKAIIQMEPDTYDHLWDKGYLQANPAAAQALRGLVGIQGGKPDIALLSSNDAYAAAMAFTRYLDHKAGTKERPLPGVNQIADQAQYWGRWYQGQHDKKKMSAYVADWTFAFGSDATEQKKAAKAKKSAARAAKTGRKKKILDHSVGL